MKVIVKYKGVNQESIGHVIESGGFECSEQLNCYVDYWHFDNGETWLQDVHRETKTLLIIFFIDHSF